MLNSQNYVFKLSVLNINAKLNAMMPVTNEHLMFHKIKPYGHSLKILISHLGSPDL